MTKNPETRKELGSSVSRKGRLLCLTFILVLLASGYGSYLVFNELKQSQETAFNQRTESIIHSLTQLAGLYIASFDWPLLEKLVQGAKSDPVVISVQIEDALSE